MLIISPIRCGLLLVGDDQSPRIDGNGNGVPNELADFNVAKEIGFDYVGTLSTVQWPPYIENITVPESPVSDGSGEIQATVLDDDEVESVWAILYPPSYTPPQTLDELLDAEPLTNITLTHQSGNLYVGEYDGFNELGEYRVVVYAKDDEGVKAKPVNGRVLVPSSLPLDNNFYLPLILP